MSRRHLERQFKQYVGISPKLLARIVWFRQVKTLVKNGRQDSLMGIAFDYGYSNQAHLTKDFKVFTGVSPLVYLAH